MGFGKAAKWSSGKESRAAKAQKRAAKAEPLLDDVADGADGEAAAARPASAQAQPQPRRTAQVAAWRARAFHTHSSRSSCLQAAAAGDRDSLAGQPREAARQ